MIRLVMDANRYGLNLGLQVDSKIYQYVLDDNRRHLDLMLQGIDWLVRDAGLAMQDITELAVTIGPGPYTSTRVAVSIAQSLAYALSISLKPMCSLHAWAWSAYEDKGHQYPNAWVFMDARQGYISYASFRWEGGILKPDHPVIKVAQVQVTKTYLQEKINNTNDACLLIGDGVSSIDHDGFNVDHESRIQTKGLLQLAALSMVHPVVIQY